MTESKSLTKEEMIALTAVVDAERERIKQLIVDNPTSESDNLERRAYITKLDFLTKRLTEVMSDGIPSS
ncbi:MAG: hypothetical protein ACREBU_10550 [Nitrososphaera sp.]